jgi:hypothetical protein
VQGTVRAPGGTPLPGASVELAPAVTTDGSGAFRTQPGFATGPGDGLLTVRPPASRPTLAPAVLVRAFPADTTVSADVSLVEGGLVRLTVNGTLTAMVPTVTLEPLDRRLPAVASAPFASGVPVTVGLVPPGRYVLRIGPGSTYHPGTPNRSQATLVDVTAGATVDLTAVSIAPGQLFVRALLDGRDRYGARTQVRRADGTLVAVGAAGLAAGNGGLQLVGLPVGEPLTVTVDSLGGRTVPWTGTVTIPATSPFRAQLTAELSRLRHPRPRRRPLRRAPARRRVRRPPHPLRRRPPPRRRSPGRPSSAPATG